MMGLFSNKSTSACLWVQDGGISYCVVELKMQKHLLTEILSIKWIKKRKDIKKRISWNSTC